MSVLDEPAVVAEGAELAPGLRVVHAGQVVVHQRVGMHGLHRSGDTDRSRSPNGRLIGAE